MQKCSVSEQREKARDNNGLGAVIRTFKENLGAWTAGMAGVLPIPVPDQLCRHKVIQSRMTR
jgi:hypothetical protein